MEETRHLYERGSSETLCGEPNSPYLTALLDFPIEDFCPECLAKLMERLSPLDLRVSKLNIRPGEVLVVHFPTDPSVSFGSRESLLEALKGILPRGSKCLMVKSGVEFSVLQEEYLRAFPVSGIMSPPS